MDKLCFVLRRDWGSPLLGEGAPASEAGSGLLWYPKLCWDAFGEAAQRDTLEVGAPTCLNQPCPSNLYLNT